MRADKYLWAVRLYKTRSLAAEALKLGRIVEEDLPLKASRNLKAGDSFGIKYAGYVRNFRVKDLPKSRVGAALVENFIEETTSPEEQEKREMLLLARKHQRSQGMGRPTKRERRDLDRWS